MKVFALYLGFILNISLSAQIQFTQASSFWDDRLDEWVIKYYSLETDREEQLDLRRKWPLQDNWDEWVFSFENKRGEINSSWKGRDDSWVLRLDGEQLYFRQRWQGDANEWQINTDKRSYIFRTEYRNSADSWLLQDRKDRFLVYLAYRNDPRDWIIEDVYPEETPLNARLAMIFICLYNSIPKN